MVEHYTPAAAGESRAQARDALVRKVGSCADGRRVQPRRLRQGHDERRRCRCVLGRRWSL